MEKNQIFKKLAKYIGDINDIEKKIKQYTWDSDTIEYCITNIDIKNIFNSYLNNEISNSQIEKWANLIECREEFEFESEFVEKVIYDIANTEINEIDLHEYITKYLSKNLFLLWLMLMPTIIKI